MKRIGLLISLIILALPNIMAQGFKMEVNITGAHDSMLLLAMHYGDDKYVRDSAKLNNKGKAVFFKDTPFEEGIYIIAMNGVQLFDFIISDKKNQNFTATTKKDDYVNSLHFKNSPENEEFSNFNRYMLKQQMREEALRSKFQENPNDVEVKKELEAEEKLIKEEYHAHVKKIEEKFPNTLLFSLAKALDRPQLPKPNIDKSNPKYDSIVAQQYINFRKNNFFDNYDFTDKRLINTPIFIPSVSYYFDNAIHQVADSIISAVDRVMGWSEPSPEMTKFMASYLLKKYIESMTMGMESVAVHIINTYYLNGLVGDQDSAFMADIRRFSMHNRYTLIGKKAYDLKMESPNGQYESVYNIDAPYMVVYLYEPSCGHCKKETPKLYNVFKKYRDKGLQVYAVYTQQNKNEWMEYVAKNGFDWINVWDPKNENNFRIKYDVYQTPLLYLLDKDKKIIGRRIDADGLDKILDHLYNDKK